MDILKEMIFIVNQTFELERKAAKITEKHTLDRNLQRLRAKYAEMGFEIHDPLGEAFNETRTDCEASITGDSTHNLRITEVIKPIIRLQQGAAKIIVQKAVVLVESRA